MKLADYIRSQDDIGLAEALVVITAVVITECTDLEIKPEGFEEAKKISLNILRKETGR